MRPEQRRRHRVGRSGQRLGLAHSDVGYRCSGAHPRLSASAAGTCKRDASRRGDRGGREARQRAAQSAPRLQALRRCQWKPPGRGDSPGRPGCPRRAMASAAPGRPGSAGAANGRSPRVAHSPAPPGDSFKQGDSADTYTLTVANSGKSPTDASPGHAHRHRRPTSPWPPSRLRLTCDTSTTDRGLQPRPAARRQAGRPAAGHPTRTITLTSRCPSVPASAARTRPTDCT